MYYTPKYRKPHDLLTAAGFNPAGRGVRGYELTRTQLQNRGYRWSHIKDLDRVHALVAHGYINMHADIAHKQLNGKIVHKSTSGYIVKELMFHVKDADVPRHRVEKHFKDLLEWVEIRRVRYRVYGFRGLIGQF